MLEHLQPERVFYYFEQICKIPHGSKNTKAISDYCVAFAKEHKLRHIQDQSNNIIIFQDGTKGYENSAPVLLQGHLDMVCEREADCDVDFLKEGISPMIEGDYVTAQGTTLGGDDGIAVAFALAILENEAIPHPPLEVVLTVDEEIGMLGATALDYSPLSARTMLNLDSEDEGVLLVSCAGGVTATCHLPVERETLHATVFCLTVTGLIGGHSGVEIDKGRANAGKVLGRVLFELSKEADIRLISLEGGLKDNAIPRQAEAQFIFDTTATEELSEPNLDAFIVKWDQILKKEYAGTDPDISLEWKTCSPENIEAMTKKSTQNAISVLYLLPNGIQAMSHDIDGLVQTSQNLGIMHTHADEITFSFSTRSSVASEKQELLSRMECLMSNFGGTVTTAGDYPAWEYRKDSPLRSLMADVFEKRYGYAPKIEAIHAGVECGLFADALPGLDCVSMGPDIKDIHTPKERLDINSVKRTWEFTLEVLKQLN